MIDKEEVKSLIVKENIVETLHNDMEVRQEDNGKCFLLIIPFCDKTHVDNVSDSPLIKKFARNLLEVDDNFYEELLYRAELFKEGIK